MLSPAPFEGWPNSTASYMTQKAVTLPAKERQSLQFVLYLIFELVII